MKYTIESDIGRKRTINEDRVTFVERSDNLKLAVLADGMGGHNAGDVASEMAIVEFENYFKQAEVSIFENKETSKKWLLDAVSDLNYKMYQYSLLHEGCQGMGTTLIVVLIYHHELIFSHVGDSRVYTFTNEEATLVTRDHSYVNMLLELGQINEEEAREHPRKNAIIKAIGTESTVEPDLYELQVTKPMDVLVCSDGLSNKLTEGEMAAILALSLPVEEKGKKLIHLANASGGEDNISLVLMSFDELEV